jgi:predicted metal-dependent phosphoesterase TrpH
MTRVDLHVKVLDETVVERSKARGLDALVYAPHFRRLPEVRREAAAYSDTDLTIVPGREVFTGTWRNRRHILVVNPENPIPDFITFEGAMEILDADAGAILIPHPTFLTVSCSQDDIRSYQTVIDGIETYNPKHLSHHNNRAARLAEDLSVPVFASSYAHLRGTVGEVWTEFEGPITSGETLVEALVSGMARTVRRQDGPAHRMRCLGEFAHLGWENSWEKIDRVLLSGMEATHPDHVAYDGQFDEIAVY